MSNFIEIGKERGTVYVPAIDCGKDGYKTDREIELEKKLDIAVEAINAVLNDEFILEHADIGLVMYLQVSLNKIKGN